MAGMAQRVLNMFELPAKPGDEELLKALRTFLSWCNDGATSPTPDDWLLAPWVALQGSPALLSRPMFAGQLRKLLQAERQPRLLGALIYSYIRDYEPASAALVLAGELIEGNLQRHDSRQAVRWRERTSEVRLFQPDGAHERVARRALEAGGDVKGLMRELGFTTELVTRSGFHEPVAESLANQLVRVLQASEEVAGETVAQVLSFYRLGSELTFPGRRAQLADALLAPFSHKELRNLPARAMLMQFFDELYGDPRSHKKRWIGVSQDAKKTITRWLSRKALDLFFDILSATADPIWKWRRAFWLALERHGVIDEAWPVFGREALEYVRKHPDKKAKIVASGQLQGAERRQSVMLMKIGKFIVAEWSHSGSARVWSEGDSRAPGLEKRFYSASDLREECLFDQRHDSTQTYRWQRELMDFFAPRIGVRVSVSEMRP
ncbi:MAG: EH signature domain-containing protein [Allosphingosinicella sp.]|uniref:EH signature domain-containing protein n=1 Tax=Allosphingosinicella sp. TaxID=2823234 RepID=UPI003942A587